MPAGIPLTYESMLPELSATACKIRLPRLSDDIRADKRFMKSRAGDFYDRCVRTRLRRSMQEKHPWTEEETGFEILSMDTKRKSKHAQVADYIPEYSINGGPWINSGLVIERKEKDDANNTFLFEMDRFRDELNRFDDDEEMFDFRILIECSYEDLMNCLPVVPKVCKCCNFCHSYHNTKKDIHKYSCTFDVLAGKSQETREIKPAGTCEYCVPHKKTEKEIGDLQSRKRGIIEDFINDGYLVLFYSSRDLAVKAIPTIARRYFISNCARLMDL